MSKILIAILSLLIMSNAYSKISGTFKLNLGQQPTTLNPLSSTDAYASTVQKYVIESLLVRDPSTYKYKPALAESWKISKDKMSYTFTIRQGVKWHDGKPLTIDDIIFSFKAIVDPKNKYHTAHLKSYFDGLKEVKKTGEHQVTFYAKNKYFGNFSTAADLKIVPKHLYLDTSKKNIRKLNKTLIGTGPYIFKKIKRGKNLVLINNKNWWGHKVAEFKDRYNFKKIMMRFIKDPTISLQRLEKGDIDFDGLRAEDYVKRTGGKRWKTKLNKVKFQNIAPKGYGFVAWNFKNDLFKSKNVRIALAHLMNRKLMIKKFLFGYAKPATGPWYQQSEYADPTVKPFQFDPKKALRLLKKEGWKDTDGNNILDKVVNGKKKQFSFTILNPSKSFLKYLTIYKEDAKKAGIDINIKYLEWNTFVKLLDEKKFEAVTLAWGAGNVDNDPKQIWHSSSAGVGGSNFISYKKKNVDKLIDKAREEFDKKKRIKMLRKVYRTIAADAPYLFMFNSTHNFYGVSKKIKRPKDTFNYEVGTSYWQKP